MKYTLSLFFILLFIIGVNAQKRCTDLYGFRLGQYRETTNAELGKPFTSGKYDDGFLYDAFLLKPDTSLYMVFEYSTADTGVIWSIQISGKDPKADIGFNDLRFGMSQDAIEKKLGKPVSIADAGEYGKRLEYDSSNFSVEINKHDVFSSVKIKDVSEIYGSSDFHKLPVFSDVKKTLTSGNNKLIGDLLAPDIEIYIGDSAYFFKRALKTEEKGDNSKIFSIIKNLAGDIKTVNPNDTNQYEECMRAMLNQNPMHVEKFYGHKAKEIVFKYYWGRYVIWEIRE